MDSLRFSPAAAKYWFFPPWRYPACHLWSLAWRSRQDYRRPGTRNPRWGFL